MTILETLHFIRPLWLVALPLAVLLPWMWRRLRRPSGDWERVCDPHLLRWLSVAQGGGRAIRAGAWLGAAGLAVAVIALAGPSWQQLPESTLSAREARVIAFDLSASMMAEDLRPNRLTRARFRIADLLHEMAEGQTGLVAYAGDAYVVSPLTNDMNTIANLLPALGPEVMPVRGSRADRALELAASLLERAGFSRGEILLVTDSARARDAAAARALADRGFVTSVLAVGTREGAPIPSGGGFVSDRSGSVVIARLDAGSLADVAEAGGGRYSEMASRDGDAPWVTMDGGAFERRDEALDQRWKDAGPYLVLLLLPLAALAFRKGAVFVLPLMLLGGLVHAPGAQAYGWDDIWQRKDQQAWVALQAEEAERAAALARDPELAGEAWYRSENYDSAVSNWQGLDSADAHYNRGNALAKLGEFEAALDAYDQALEQQPDMADARHNRELVERALEQQRQQQEQEQEQEQSEDGDEGESSQEASDESSPGDSESEPAEGDENQQGEEGQEGEQEPQEAEPGEEGEGQEKTDYEQAWSEEDAQAMEQWLRRIPDDPGGLLRRKFIYEHQRRGAPEEEADPW
ncbi:VWA domain-containing protein [Elongatibacter sediminis]|uniref:VWA domain-containing protein n=1 Tax=Elongatibacter sediminis TaxID=3119006 RepID=A0AAW9R5M8_9GAMM